MLQASTEIAMDRLHEQSHFESARVSGSQNSWAVNPRGEFLQLAQTRLLAGEVRAASAKATGSM